MLLLLFASPPFVPVALKAARIGALPNTFAPYTTTAAVRSAYFPLLPQQQYSGNRSFRAW